MPGLLPSSGLPVGATVSGQHPQEWVPRQEFRGMWCVQEVLPGEAGKGAGQAQDQVRCDLRQSPAERGFNLIPQGALEGKLHFAVFPSRATEPSYTCTPGGVLTPRHFRLSSLWTKRATIPQELSNEVPQLLWALTAHGSGAKCSEMINRDPGDCPPTQECLWPCPGAPLLGKEHLGATPGHGRHEEFPGCSGEAQKA